MQAPLAPDVSKEAYDRYIYGDNYSSEFDFSHTLDWWFSASKNRRYNAWKQEQQAAYNKAYTDWETYVNSYAAQKEALESAGYNPNYTGLSSTAGQAGSPGQFTAPDDPSGNGAANVIASIGDILGLISGVQGIQQASQLIRRQGIENSFLEESLGLDMDLKRGQKSSIGYQNQAAMLTLQKTLFELFGDQTVPGTNETASQAVGRWLAGFTGDIDRKRYPGGLDEIMAAMVVNGPYAKQFKAKTDAYEATIKSKDAQTALTELKKTWQGTENEWQEFSKGFKVLYPIMQFLATVFGK